GDDRGVVAVAALVVGLGEQAEEGALGGQGDGGQGLGDEGFGLDGADSCQEGASSLGGRWAGCPRFTVGRGPRRHEGRGCPAVDAGALMAARAFRAVVNIATPRSRKSSPLRRNLSRQKCRWKSSRRWRCENGRARSAVDQIVAPHPEPEGSHREA